MTVIIIEYSYSQEVRLDAVTLLWRPRKAQERGSKLLQCLLGMPTFPGWREIHWHSLYKTNAPACELQQDLGTEAKKDMSVLANVKIRFEVNNIFMA
jgi:hypothetical protein